MITLTVAVGDKVEQYSIDEPEHIPVAGDLYMVEVPFMTLRDERYIKGDVLLIMGRTEAVPDKRKLSIGNLLVTNMNNQTWVWTTIELMANQGIIKLQTRH